MSSGPRGLSPHHLPSELTCPAFGTLPADTEMWLACPVSELGEVGTPEGHVNGDSTSERSYDVIAH